MDKQQLLRRLSDRLGVIDNIEGAVKQLEEQQGSLMADVDKRIQARLTAAQMNAFDHVGRYRGVFACEADARAFGLAVMAMYGGDHRKRCAEALFSEHRDFAQKMGLTRETDPLTSTDASSAIPEEVSSQLIRLVEDYGVFEREAQIWPMGSSKLRIPKRTGGVEAKPVDEAAETEEDKPTLAPVALEANKWGVHVFVAREAEMDSVIGVAELVMTEMAHAFAVAADKAGFIGDGGSGHAGITGVVPALGDAAIVQLDTGDDSWSDITADDIDKLIGTLPVYAQRGAKFHCTNAFFWQVMNPLIRATGGATMGEFQGVRMLQYQGWPVVINQVMAQATAAEQVPLIFGDLRRAAAVGRRQTLEIRRSEHYKFLNDIVTLQALRRFDIVVHSAGGESLVEAVVGLKTGATNG